MNPLEHFGIKNQMIRGDTKSYNKKKKSVDEIEKLEYSNHYKPDDYDTNGP